MRVLTNEQQQEQMHAYNANDAVRYFTSGKHVLPCTYNFPVSSFHSAIAFAQTFTDMYIGLIMDVQMRTAQYLGSEYAPLIVYALAQALGQEGQQSGWFRTLLGKPPSAEPYLTPSTRELTYSWLQRFTVPGSCPNATGTGAEIDIPLRTFPRLDVCGEVNKKGPLTLCAPGVVDPKKMSVALVNGSLMPIVLPITIVKRGVCDAGGGRYQKPLACGVNGADGVVTTFTVNFPYENNVMNGLILVAVVESDGAYAIADDVSDKTLFGPAVIELA